MTAEYWERRFREIGAIFEHDGKPQRPYVLLTTPAPDGRRRMTNKYFNGAVVQAHANIFGEACRDLAELGAPYDTFSGPLATTYVVGAAEGGIALSTRIAEELDVRSAYAVKQGEELVFERFAFKDRSAFILAEDTVTTGGTLVKLAAAIRAAIGGRQPVICPKVLCFCKRLGDYNLLHDKRIIPLIEQEVVEWTEGENPFTGGPELVPPIKAKTHWHELTQPYD